MSELIKSLFDALKLSPSSLAIVAIVSAVLLLSPAQYLDILGVTQLAKDHRAWIGGALLFAIASLLVRMLQPPLRWLRQRNFNRQLRERLYRLSEEEKQILRFYVAQQTRTNMLRIDDGVVKGLEAEGIIHRVTTMANALNPAFAYNINEFAWTVLNEQQHILMGETDWFRTDANPRRNW